MNSDEDLLIGWKNIASYLEISLRTVQRWEKDKGLPITRYTISGKVYTSISGIEYSNYLPDLKILMNSQTKFG